MVQHLQHAALDAGRIEREQPDHRDAEVAHRRVGDELLPVLLGERDHRAVDDPDHAEREEPRQAVGGLLGEDRQAEAVEAVGAHLQQDAGEDHRAGRRGLDVGVGEPGVEREHRDLDREAEEEGEEDPDPRAPDGGRRPELQQLDHVEGPRPQRLAGLEVEGDDAEQHQHRAEQGVEEELDRGVELPRPAPDADDEVHRHQHHFPEDVEEEEVERAEDAQHPDFEEQEEDVVLLHPLLDRRPAAQDRDEAEQGRQDHQQQRHAVHAQLVLDAEGRDPLRRLDELEAAVPPVVLQHGNQRDEEDEERAPGRDVADRLLVLLRHEEDDRQRRRQRQENDGGKNRHHVRHDPFRAPEVSGRAARRRPKGRRRQAPSPPRRTARNHSAAGAAPCRPARPTSRRRSPPSPRPSGRTPP